MAGQSSVALYAQGREALLPSSDDTRHSVSLHVIHKRSPTQRWLIRFQTLFYISCVVVVVLE